MFGKIFHAKVPTWLVAIVIMLALVVNVFAHSGIPVSTYALTIYGTEIGLVLQEGADMTVLSGSDTKIDLVNATEIGFPASVSFNGNYMNFAVVANKVAASETDHVGTIDYAIAGTDCGKTFTNEGSHPDGGLLRVSLPSATTYEGCELTFLHVGVGNFVINTSVYTERIRPWSGNDGWAINSTGIGNTTSLVAAHDDWYAVFNGVGYESPAPWSDTGSTN